MRVPWLIVGTTAGFVAMALLLPCCSDATGTIQSVVVVACLLGGFFFGLLLDAANPPRIPPISE